MHIRSSLQKYENRLLCKCVLKTRQRWSIINIPVLCMYVYNSTVAVPILTKTLTCSTWSWRRWWQWEWLRRRAHTRSRWTPRSTRCVAHRAHPHTQREAGTGTGSLTHSSRRTHCVCVWGGGREAGIWLF